MAQNIMRNRRVTNAEMSRYTPRIFLSKEQLSRCSICHEYLSVGPVVILNNTLVCGRCDEESKEGSPASFYEIFAQYMFFPCKYDIYGCNVKSAWGSVLLHENNCKFAPILCPAVDCLKEIVEDEIVSHFSTKHKNLLLKTNTFDIPTQYGSENEYINKLVIWEDEPLILKINFSHDYCFCSLLSLKGNKDKKLFYNLLIEDDNKRHSVKINENRVQEYRVKLHDTLIMTKLDINELTRVLKSDDITCTFNILAVKSVNSNSMNKDLLSELECTVCTNYIKPPIFMCITGHSICNVCNQIVKKCPLCKLEVKGHRNIALEKITEHVEYPCRYVIYGCTFSGKFRDIPTHEALCTIGMEKETDCYLNNVKPCSWRGSYSDIISHISVKHADNYINLDVPIVLNLKVFTELYAFTEYDEEHFRLCVSYIEKSRLRFSLDVMKISENIENNYRYHLYFLNTNGDTRFFNISVNCRTALPSNKKFNNCLVIPTYLIRPCIRDNIVRCRINIETL